MRAIEQVGNTLNGGGGSLAATFGVGAIGAALTTLKAATKIKQSEMGVRTHFGRTHRSSRLDALRGKWGEPYGSVGPGIRWMIPGAQSIDRINVGRRTQTLPRRELDIKGDKQYAVEASIQWAVRKDYESLHNAIYGIDEGSDLKELVANLCGSNLRQFIEGKESTQVKDQILVAESVQDMSRDSLLELGVELHSLELQSSTRTLGEMFQAIPNPNIAALAAAALASEIQKEIPSTDIPETTLHIVPGREAL